ncbi:hypothetical protein PPERSA_06231 [Pseudocohnilembus persalinus]|uniref:Uncharacterized protein n=1 Tax=Pseudocohnilembus persalinus TaxID=266149 RepID=A0A0V0R1M0_PSEPJ|nr:hypothetical protein PPERSA_06231 [Pseudocohnilembus persalinus]|eukprot:KRX08053.1 hypothetical protein PPERSA_06231 [Pseudocohnilembus persalinus]
MSQQSSADKNISIENSFNKQEDLEKISKYNSQSHQDSQEQINTEVKIDEAIDQQFNGQDAFLTEFKNSNLVKDMDPQVVELAEQLNDLVNQLETKIDGVIEKHEGEFLIAYKNHMQKIRRELLEMKRKTDEQERNFQAKDRISGLEKQLAWFREEASKLYNKLESKNKETDQLKMRIQDLEKEKIFLEGQVKSLMKKNKYMNVKLNSQKLDQQDTQQQNSQNYYQTNSFHHSQFQSQQHQKPRNINNSTNLKQIFDPLNINSNKTKSQQQIKGEIEAQISINQQEINDNFSSQQQQQQQNFSQIQQQIDSIKSLVHFSQSDQQAQQIVDIFVQNIQQFGFLEGQMCAKDVINHLKKIEEDRYKVIKKYKDKSEQLLKEKIKLNNTRSDLEAFFLECVQAVRRQVLKRKQPQDNINQLLAQVQDYNVFRLEDKQKILELMVQHEKILLYIYQKIFPTQFSLHIKNVLEQEKNPNQQAASYISNNQENKSEISNYQTQNDNNQFQSKEQSKQGNTYLENLYRRPSSRGVSTQNKARINRNSNISFDYGHQQNPQQYQQQNNFSSNNNINNNYHNIILKNNIALPMSTQSKHRSNTQYQQQNNFSGYSKVLNQSKSIQNSNYNNNNNNKNNTMGYNLEGLVNNPRKRGIQAKIKVESGKLTLKQNN